MAKMTMDQLKALAVKELGVDVTALPPQTCLSDIGVSSIDMVMFAYELEELLGDSDFVTELQAFETIGELLNSVVHDRPN